MTVFLKISILSFTLFFLAPPYCGSQEIFPLINNTPASTTLIPDTLQETLLPKNSLQAKASFMEQLLGKAAFFEKAADNDAALFWYRIALSYSLPASQTQLSIYNSIGYLLISKGAFEEALNIYYRILAFTNNDHRRAIFYLQIHGIFVHLENYIKAFQNMDEAYTIFEKEQNHLMMAVTLGKKASLYKDLNDSRKYVSENIKVLAMLDKIKTDTPHSAKKNLEILDIRSAANNDIGDGYMMLNMPDSALYYLHKVEQDFGWLPTDAQSVALINLGQAYLLKKDNRIAAAYLNRGKTIIYRSGSRALQLSMNGELAQLYERMGNYEEAWMNQKEYSALKDSLTSVATIHRINALETKFALTQKDQQLAVKELQLVRQASRLKEGAWLAVCLLLVLIFFGILFLVSRKSQRNKQKLLQEKLNSADREQKMVQIEAGIKGEEKERTRIARELHDGVVSEVLVLKLGLKAMEKAFSGLKHTNHYENALQQSEVIALKLRQTAHNLMPLKLREEGLYASIAAFLKRVGNRNTKFSFQHYGTLPLLRSEVEKIILLIILELIQNIIKHSKATRAIIQLDYFEGTLSITAEDNGVGMPSVRDSTDEGMGLHNIRENILLLQASIDIKSSEYTGTTVLIEIPVEHFMEALTG